MQTQNDHQNLVQTKTNHKSIPKTNPKSNFAVGIDLNVVQMRDYDMQFGLRDYKTTSGHLNLYYDAGKSFDLEMNIGKYLAKDLGITTKISRRFGNG